MLFFVKTQFFFYVILKGGNSIFMGLLTRGRKLLPLVREFQFYSQWLVPPHFPSEDLDKLLQTFPKGASIVNRRLMHGGGFWVCDSVVSDECSSRDKGKIIFINGFAGNFSELAEGWRDSFRWYSKRTIL